MTTGFRRSTVTLLSLAALAGAQPEAFCEQAGNFAVVHSHVGIAIVAIAIGFILASCLAFLWTRRLRRKARERAALQSALRELPVGILIADAPSGRITFANRAASEILEVPLRDLINIDLENAHKAKFSTYEIDGSPCPIERTPLFQAMVEDRICENRELIIRQDSGAETVVFAGSAPVRDYAGKTFAVIAVFNDVSVARRASTLLNKRSEELATLFENISQGVVLVGPDLRISAYNKKLLELLEISPDFIAGRPYMDKLVDFWKEASNQPQDEVDRVRRELLSREPFTHEFLFKNRFLEMRHSPLSDGSFVRTVTDISDRKRAEEERLKSEREALHTQKLESLGILAGGIAHDFNNLILALMGNLELAKASSQNPEEVLKRIDDAESAAHRASDLTRQLLAYSGKGKLQVRDFDLSNVVKEMAALLKVSVSKTADLKISLEKELPFIKGDSTQVQQVVMNLIVNASEAIGTQRGVIEVCTGVREWSEEELSASRLLQRPAPGRFVYLKVRDTGCGMEEDTLKHLFDPFFTTKPKGHGLGMSATLGIMRSHNGAIIVSSEKGKGSEFTILFPAIPEDQTPRAVELPPARNATKVEERAPVSGCIMIVDDEAMVRSLCCALVEKIGFSYVAAADGLEAMEIYKAERARISCVLLDISMPGMDGKEVLQGLQKIDPDVKVALSSGHNFDEVANHFAGCKIAGFIQKPYHLEELGKELRRIIAS